MPNEVLPLITEAEYPDFQARIGVLPRTYDGWRRLREAERRRGRTAYGAYPADIPISIAEFITFRRARPTHPASVDMLWRCAIEKAAQASPV